jgi:hypothetical protein
MTVAPVRPVIPKGIKMSRWTDPRSSTRAATPILDIELFRAFVKGLDLRLQLIILVIPGSDSHLPLTEFLLHFVVL